MADEPVFDPDKCPVPVVPHIPATLLSDATVQPPPADIPDCLDPAFPPLPPEPPAGSGGGGPTCPTITIDGSNAGGSIVVNGELTEPQLSFSVLQTSGCTFDFGLAVELPPQTTPDPMDYCPALEVVLASAVVNPALSEPQLSFGIEQALDSCEFGFSLLLELPEYCREVGLTSGGFPVFYDATAVRPSASLDVTRIDDCSLDVSASLTLPVRNLAVMTDLFCDEYGVYTARWTDITVLATGKRYEIELECPPTTCCPATTCHTIHLHIDPLICGVGDIDLHRDAAVGEWVGTAVTEYGDVLTFRFHCVGGRSFVHVYCDDNYFYPITGEVVGDCGPDLHMEGVLFDETGGAFEALCPCLSGSFWNIVVTSACTSTTEPPETVCCPPISCASLQVQFSPAVCGLSEITLDRVAAVGPYWSGDLVLDETYSYRVVFDCTGDDPELRVYCDDGVQLYRMLHGVPSGTCSPVIDMIAVMTPDVPETGCCVIGAEDFVTAIIGGCVTTETTTEEPVSVPCCPGPIPARLYAYFSGGTGACTCLHGEVVELNFAGGVWTGEAVMCGDNVYGVTLGCDGVNWYATLCGLVLAVPPTVNCDAPFSVTFANGIPGACCSGTVTLIITETPP